MAESSPEFKSSNKKAVIHIKVLSPSLPPLTLPSVAVSTTVSELKDKICRLAPTRPPIGNQRLIYRGHPLLRSDQTLKDLFSQQIINENDSIVIHLVMPPVAPASALPGSSAQHLAGFPTTTNVHSSHNVQAAAIVPQNSQPTNNAPSLASNQPHMPQIQPISINARQPAEPQAQFPPHLQQTFNQFQAIQQQLAAQLASLNNHPNVQGHTAQQNAQIQQPYTHLPQAITEPQVQQFFPQQQQQSQQNLAGVVSPGQSPMLQQQFHQNTFQHWNSHLIPNLFTGPVNTNTVVREHLGPNGQRWSTVTHFGTPNVANPVHAQQHPGTAQSVTPSIGAGTPYNSSIPPVTNASTSNIPGSAGSSSEDPSQTSSKPEPTPSLASTNLTNNESYMLRAAQERATQQRESRGNDSSAVYVLSSSSGPQALLISPQGNFTAPWPVPNQTTLLNLAHSGNLVPGATGFIPTLGIQHTNVAPQGPQGGYNQAANAQQPQHAMQLTQTQPQAQGQPNIAAAVGINQQQQQQQQQAQQARDLARVIMPLGGHLWLFIRLFGFVYFFTHGASWSRTLFLIAVATLVFVGQTGIIRPLVQGLWEPVRRHAENLLPLANNEQPRDENAGPAVQTNANAAGTQGGNRQPTPQEAAQRLLEQRQNDNIVRQGLRRIERAIALFIASLVPGVGERHIAAREAAEAARQAEIREREDQARREEEDARQQQAGSSSAGTDGTCDRAVGPGSEGAAAASQTQD
ncbi:MAG: hypothetical protein Q9164_002219 [Protoblastenia rupestris]